MKKVISTERKPIKLWLTDLEDGALAQAKNLANLPFAFKHIPIMPDSHQGYGMPIGSILATKGVVVPNAVGVDIGCGMCAMRTSLEDVSKEALKKTLSIARQLIPLGFNCHDEAQDEKWMPEGYENLEIVAQAYEKGTRQVGTLGGGNHFIELQKGSDGYIWIMIHSGSRALGYTVAKHYNKLAIALNERYHSVVTKKMELAFLPLSTQEAKDYIKEMDYCIEYALANRKLMMTRMAEALEAVVGTFECDEIINKSHNFAAWENHFGEEVLVHRKGATRAYKDELGMIPGSQGTNSYIVKGLGNPDSFMSCSHGAGRKLGRKQAQRELNLAHEIELLNKKGVIHAIRHASDLDEATGAYKDIDIVMENQKDLAEVFVELSPLAVLKG
ncbi:RtcB family protein [Aureispira anguillae]|uniref:3'-phosphate/5'-hydroxy nucleic acid ligase n=1 Tax=Aureispira anguillae TaxID=2864201 RepID=A0A915YHN3_9BACT|nr:RtcB family protein [Aureispira anguillae]BDS13189.1 RtcB family protein [Aureispira anguillae]